MRMPLDSLSIDTISFLTSFDYSTVFYTSTLDSSENENDTGVLLYLTLSLEPYFEENIIDTYEVTNFNQSLLDQLNVKEEWIPEEFLCGITQAVIDDTPVYFKNSKQTIPQRYQETALLAWLEQNPTDPITRMQVTKDDIVKDYVLGAKIKSYIDYIQTHVDLLKNMPEELAQQSIAEFFSEVEIKMNRKAFIPVAFKPNFFAPQNSGQQLSRSLVSEIDYATAFINRNGNCYDILQISFAAKREEITRAYKKLALQFHPDKNSNDTTEKFRLIKEAYDILTKPSLKTHHDQCLLSENRQRLTL